MLYRNIFLIIFLLFLSNCVTAISKKNIPNASQVNVYSNKGFALIYSDRLYKTKIVSKQINERGLMIFQKNLKTNTHVKITNILNNKTIIATVGKNSIYPSFNNAVVSKRIANELHLDINQPYVEILEIVENSMFVAKIAKTYDEEKNVAIKVPVKSISINNLNIIKKKNRKKIEKIFFYTLKIADFYFSDSALSMVNRIKMENIMLNPKIKKISDNKHRVYLGPFDNINSLQKSYNDISIMEFENIEIIRND